MAGLPQDEEVVWCRMNKTHIQKELAKSGYEISIYHVTQILDTLGLRERSFQKSLPMRDVKDRNEQFENSLPRASLWRRSAFRPSALTPRRRN